MTDLPGLRVRAAAAFSLNVRLQLTFAVLLMAVAGFACAEHMEEVVVHGEPLSPFQAHAGMAPLAETNTALLLKRVAGANVNFNGSLAGMAQYRGLYGARVNTAVDGMDIGNACSNNMDAPLHYLPRTRVDDLSVIRGIAPISSGLETLGGTVIANSTAPIFGTADTFAVSGHTAAAGQSVDGGYSLSGDAALADRRHRLFVAASYEDGSNRDFGAGTIRPSRYERSAVDLGYARQLTTGVLSIDYRRNDTSDAGTPALPMDDISSDADLLRAGYSAVWGVTGLDATVYWNDIEHLMSNYRMRPARSGMRRDNAAQADTLGWRVSVTRPLLGGALRVGTDGHAYDYDADVADPDNAMFFMQTFHNVKRDRYGLYAEWVHDDLGPWQLTSGVRWTHTSSDAGEVNASMAMMMPALAMLRDRFNASDRSRADDQFDFAAVAAYALSDSVSLELGVARKNRSPTYQERYLWAPIEASGGLSDGNVYIGDVELDEETAWQFELGLDWRTGRFDFAPRVFYHRIDDYIQGIPATDPAVIMVGVMNGDPTPLQFANVDAELWGADAEWSFAFTDAWQARGVVSWVRGKRRDIDDDLFRIAPLNTLVDLSYRAERWSVTLETEVYARQSKVSLTNGETRSPGYALLNLYAEYMFPRYGLQLMGGIENLLDKTYRPHLNGINRVAASDVAVGARLPGDGINIFVQAGWSF